MEEIKITKLDTSKGYFSIKASKLPPDINLEDFIRQFKTNQIMFVEDEEHYLTFDDIRNKLSPIKNLIKMIENGLVKGSVETHDLVLKEIEQCKESIEYLSRGEHQESVERTLELDVDYCNKYKWGDCECTDVCRRGLEIGKVN